jgi:hypothetical protein
MKGTERGHEGEEKAMRNIDALGRIGAEVAMVAAADVLRAAGRREDGIAERVCERLRIVMPDAIAEGLRDAKEALDANMAQVAEATFLATLRLAAIKATKEVLAA